MEPYTGGAGVALELLTKHIVSRIMINDLDKNIYAFWTALFQEYSRFIEKIKNVPLTIEEWRKQRSILEDNECDNFCRGFATFFLNRVNYSGILNARPIGGVEQKGKWKIDARFNRVNLIQRLEHLYDFRSRMEVTNKDGAEIIREYLGKNDYFLYIDPPYVRQGKNLYLTFHSESKHIELAELLNHGDSYNWILSYDCDPMIENLYSNQIIERQFLYHRANRRKHDQEYLIHSRSLVM